MPGGEALDRELTEGLIRVVQDLVYRIEYQSYALKAAQRTGDYDEAVAAFEPDPKIQGQIAHLRRKAGQAGTDTGYRPPE